MPPLKGTGLDTTPSVYRAPLPSRPVSPSRERLRKAQRCCLEREDRRRAAPASPSLRGERPPRSKPPCPPPPPRPPPRRLRPVCVREEGGLWARGAPAAGGGLWAASPRGRPLTAAGGARGGSEAAGARLTPPCASRCRAAARAPAAAGRGHAL